MSKNFLPALLLTALTTSTALGSLQNTDPRTPERGTRPPATVPASPSRDVLHAALAEEPEASEPGYAFIDSWKARASDYEAGLATAAAQRAALTAHVSQLSDAQQTLIEALFSEDVPDWVTPATLNALIEKVDALQQSHRTDHSFLYPNGTRNWTTLRELRIAITGLAKKNTAALAALEAATTKQATKSAAALAGADARLTDRLAALTAATNKQASAQATALATATAELHKRLGDQWQIIQGNSVASASNEKSAQAHAKALAKSAMALDALKATVADDSHIQSQADLARQTAIRKLGNRLKALSADTTAEDARLAAEIEITVQSIKDLEERMAAARAQQATEDATARSNIVQDTNEKFANLREEMDELRAQLAEAKTERAELFSKAVIGEQMLLALMGLSGVSTMPMTVHHEDGTVEEQMVLARQWTTFFSGETEGELVPVRSVDYRTVSFSPPGASPLEALSLSGSAYGSHVMPMYGSAYGVPFLGKHLYL